MALYVHVNEKNAPYLDAISFDEKDGYDEKPYLDPDKMVTLMYNTDKCYLDKDGNVVVPDIQPELSDTDKQLQEAQKTIEIMQKQLSSLVLFVAKGGNK